MKSFLNNTIMVSSLFLLAGCYDFGWSKKNNTEKQEISTRKNSSKCSHKSCTHNHSKDVHTKNHDDEIIETMDDEIMYDNDMNLENTEDDSMMDYIDIDMQNMEEDLK